MKKILLLLALAGAVASAPASSVDLPNGRRVDFITQKWKLADNPAPPSGVPEVGRTVTYTPPDGANGSLLLTVLTTPDDRFADAAALKGMHELGNQQYVEGSIEKKVNSEELKLVGGRGYHSVFTDASLVGKPSKQGDTKTVDSMTIYLGKGELVVVSIFTDDAKGALHDDAMKIVRSLQLYVPGQSL